MRPLDFLRSIKVKLGVLIVGSTAVSIVVIAAGIAIGVPYLLTAALAGFLALGMVQLLARGMTSPLRDMADAAGEMANGNYERRVRATSRDEVGDLARAFNSMAAELAENERIRRDLIANVSHELRTPISGLQAALENLVDGVVDANPNLLHTMLVQTERLGALVNELLELSRLESGAITLELSNVDVRSLLDECADESQMARPDIEVSVDAPSELHLAGDRERLRQVVTNLLVNARRVTPSGESIELIASEGDAAVRFEVADKGPGIPSEDQARVFERFYRVDDARSSNDGGAGLGLAIVKWIVDLHGGTIRPEENHPHGCRMVVVLPQGAS